MTDYAKPVPVPDEVTRPFWEAARSHQLHFQRCTHCGTYAHPPTTFCHTCHDVTDPAFEFAPITPRARIVNWTVMYDAMVAGFAEQGPWVHALVAFDDQPDLTFTATLLDGVSDRLELGAPVEVVFDDVTDDVTLPMLRLIQPQPPERLEGETP